MGSKELEHSRRNVASRSMLVIEGTVCDGRWSIHPAQYITDLFEANGHDVLTGELDTETGRPTDAYSYRLRELETDEKLPLAVRHQNLVPVKDIQ